MTQPTNTRLPRYLLALALTLVVAFATACSGTAWQDLFAPLFPQESYVDNGSPELDDLLDLPDGYESYNKLDSLGRCGVAVAKVGPETLPTKDMKRDREGESHIHPTGWKQAFYPDLIDTQDGALYNRCHLIAWSLADESANKQNLITGTRQMNEAMTTFEKKVKRYVDSTGGHVIYRVTPDFQGRELVARGVRIEAQSVEDHGRKVSIDVYIPNEQDGVEIDYASGKNWAKK